MSRRLAQGAVGGDLNCVVVAQDCTSNFQGKVSPSFRKLVSAFNWSDSFCVLYPKRGQFSRYFSNVHQGEGASHIDRSYHWGNIKGSKAEYMSISFSDHLSLKLSYILPSKLDRCLSERRAISESTRHCYDMMATGERPGCRPNHLAVTPGKGWH